MSELWAGTKGKCVHRAVRAVAPVRRFRGGCTHRERPLYKFAQLMRCEWVACLPCGSSGAIPDADGKPVMPIKPSGLPWAAIIRGGQFSIEISTARR